MAENQKSGNTNEISEQALKTAKLIMMMRLNAWNPDASRDQVAQTIQREAVQPAVTQATKELREALRMFIAVADKDAPDWRKWRLGGKLGAMTTTQLAHAESILAKYEAK